MREVYEKEYNLIKNDLMKKNKITFIGLLSD